MPRKARIDAPGALHHIIVRGIERRRILTNNRDQDNFIERLGDIVTETETFCFAWALIPNHSHILLRTEKTSPCHGYDLIGYSIDPAQVWAYGKHTLTVQARSLFCYWAVRKLGFRATELSKKLGVSQPSVSISVKRGEKISKTEQLELGVDYKVINL